MAYTPQTWADEPSQTTPINASRLAHIETGLQTAAAVADSASTAAAGAQPADADLTTIAALDSTVVGAIASDGAGWVSKSVAAMRTWLGLGTAALVNTGTGASNAILGNDSRLTDSRTPTAHASTHASAGSDPVTIAESQVTNLTTDLAAKAPLASPTFTGTPAAPTAAPGTNTTQLATTAFVTAAASSNVLTAYLTGSPTSVDSTNPPTTTSGLAITLAAGTYFYTLQGSYKSSASDAFRGYMFFTGTQTSLTQNGYANSGTATTYYAIDTAAAWISANTTAGNVYYPFEISGYIVVTVSGNLQLRFGSAGGATFTLHPGTYLSTIKIA